LTSRISFINAGILDVLLLIGQIVVFVRWKIRINFSHWRDVLHFIKIIFSQIVHFLRWIFLHALQPNGIPLLSFVGLSAKDPFVGNLSSTTPPSPNDAVIASQCEVTQVFLIVSDLG
jgi:hypothetical protein